MTWSRLKPGFIVNCHDDFDFFLIILFFVSAICCLRTVGGFFFYYILHEALDQWTHICYIIYITVIIE